MTHRRLFFALWPDADIRAGIVERRKQVEGLSRQRVPDHNLHLTLLFLGDQPADRLDEIVEAAQHVQSERFDLTLDRFGTFQRARVAWLGGPATPAATKLVTLLTAEMTALGLHFDHRDWTPHVTLFRKLRSKPRLPPVEPLAWPVARFELIESMAGKPYSPLTSVALP